MLRVSPDGSALAVIEPGRAAVHIFLSEDGFEGPVATVHVADVLPPVNASALVSTAACVNCSCANNLSTCCAGSKASRYCRVPQFADVCMGT